MTLVAFVTGLETVVTCDIVDVCKPVGGVLCELVILPAVLVMPGEVISCD